jgi:hypothetical protein
MDLLDTFLYLFAPFVPLLVAFLYRRRILRAVSRAVMADLEALAFEDVETVVDGAKVRKKALSPQAITYLEAAAPALIKAGIQSVKLKMPAQLPINPVTGQLDFMVPIMTKMASGRKVSMEDFFPILVEKAMPLVEGFLGGAAKRPQESLVTIEKSMGQP